MTVCDLAENNLTILDLCISSVDPMLNERFILAITYT